MKTMTCGIIVLCAALWCGMPALVEAESVSNGTMTMFTVGDNVLTILLHAEKKILVYRVAVTPATIALKSVRTWHYDGQFANTLKTLAADGTYPNRKIDNNSSPSTIAAWLKLVKVVFNPEFKIPGVNAVAPGVGADLSITFNPSSTEALLVLFDAKNSALLVYRIKEQGVDFLACRSIIADVQIPIFYPAEMQDTPAAIRDDLKKAEEKLPKGKKLPQPGVEFVVEDMEYVIKMQEKKD